MLKRALALAFGLFFYAQAFFFLFKPGRIVAFPGNAFSAVKFEDPSSNVVKEIAIMRHRDDGSLVVLQMPFQPGNRFSVEMVGRLIQQENIGLFKQDLGQRDASAFTT